jgi:membrane protein
VNVLVRTFKEFAEDDCPRMAAALAYYTVFALPPMLVLVMLVAGVFVSPDDIMDWLRGQMTSEDTARQVETMLRSAREKISGGLSIALILSIVGLVFSATGAFGQFQKALNTAWEVEPDPERKGTGKILQLLTKRLLSLGMIIVVAFLLVVALAVSSVIATFSSDIADLLMRYGTPPFLANVLPFVTDPLVSIGILWLLFGAMFMVLPDARVAWRHVSVGALITAVLFVLGKLALGLYISQSNPGDAFGAAGALAVILVFIYYASMIVLLGAEFTQVWARSRGAQVVPERNAVRTIRERRHVRENGGEVGDRR